MKWRTAIANVIGCIGIACSFAFWIEACVSKVVGHTPVWLDMGLDGWVWGWALGIVLALTAAVLGPRRWAFAALLPIVSFLVFIVLVGLSPPDW
jgi:hypothetical protein